MSLTTRIVSALRGNDTRRAAQAEQDHVGTELARAAGQDAATARYTDGDVDLGLRFLTGESLRVPMQRAMGHWGLWGPSGAGKTYALLLLMRAFLLSLILRGRASVRSVTILDPKQETVDLAKRLVLSLARDLPDGDALLDRVVVIEPFSTTALPPMQVLLPDGDPGLGTTWAPEEKGEGKGSADPQPNPVN